MRVVLGLFALVWLQQTPWAQAVLVGVILIGIAAVAWVVFEHLQAESEPVLRRRVEPAFDFTGAEGSDRHRNRHAKASTFTDGDEEFSTEGENPFSDMDAAELGRFLAHLIATKTTLEGEVSGLRDRLKVLETKVADFPARLSEASDRGRDEVFYAFGHDREGFERLLREFALRKQQQRRDKGRQDDQAHEEGAARKGRERARRTRSAKPWWQVLGVSPTATEGEVRRAYRTLAKRFHPDCGTGDADRMAEINAARDEAMRRFRRAA